MPASSTRRRWSTGSARSRARPRSTTCARPPASSRRCTRASSTRSSPACANAISSPRSTTPARAASTAIGGDYPAIVPLLPSGADASAPHLTWDDKPMKSGEGTFFEIAGCYNRYHCPLSRTVFLGKPTQAFLDAEKATLEGMEAGLAAAKPGNTCEDIANAFFAVLKRYGIVKDNRTGYPIGLSYPPDWGERTMSLRPGDRTELEARHDLPFHDRPVARDDGARDHREHPHHRDRRRMPRRTCRASCSSRIDACGPACRPRRSRRPSISTRRRPARLPAPALQPRRFAPGAR